MKRITILALHLGYGGIEKYLSSLTKMLKDNYKIKIISTYKIFETPPFDFDGVEIEYLINSKPLKKELSESIKNKDVKNIIKYAFSNAKILLYKYTKNIKSIKKIDSDYIITTRDFHNKLVKRFAKKDIKKIATEHNYHNNDKKYINKVLKSIKGFEYLVLVSKELEKFYSPLVKPTKCLYISNVIDKMSSKPLGNNKYNLISVGRLSPEKGFDDLILIMEKLVKINKKYHLDLIGDGPELNSLKTLITEKKLDKNIKLHGFLNQDEINEIMLNNSLYVMTSHTESFGIVLIEAMSHSLPCVSFTSARGACEIIKQKNLLIENRDLSKMVSTIDTLINDKEKLKKIGLENYKNSKIYLPSNVVKQWKKILK